MARDATSQPDLSQLERAEPRASNLAAPPFQVYPPSPDPFLRTPIPPSQWLQPDSLRQFYQLGNPQNRVAPLGANAQAAINSTAKGVSTTVSTAIVNSAIEKIPPAAAATTDGLVHGDAISELDAGYFWQRDEFDTFTTVPAPINAAGAGRLGWSPYINPFSFKNFGSGLVPPIFNGIQCQFQSINTAQSTHGMVLPIQQPIGEPAAMWPLADYPTWKATFVFTPCQFGQGYASGSDFSLSYGLTRLYIGFASAFNDANGTNSTSRPFCFMGLRFDTDTTAPSIADTTFHFECVSNLIADNTTGVGNNLQGNVFNTGIAPTENVAYRLDMECVTAGQIIFTLSGNGVTTGPQTLNVPLYTFPGGTINVNSITFSGNTNYPTMRFNVGGLAPNRGGCVWGSGSIIAVSGITGALAPYNGTYTVLLGQNDGFITKDSTVHGAGLVGTAGTAVTSGRPAFLPCWLMATNNLTSAITINMALRANYYGFVWNTGIGNPSATTNSLQARYW
jgi:hypothetical protein